MSINSKNINNIFYIFVTAHLMFWTLIPSITNHNLALDTIEALAWGSNLDWGYNKHPPFSAFAVELFYFTFGNNDWSYYLLSQLFVITAFFFVWKLSNEIFDDKSDESTFETDAPTFAEIVTAQKEGNGLSDDSTFSWTFYKR